MQLKQAQRQQVKLRVGISGASGFGKTYSALLLAFGITNDYSKIAIIDTENKSACLYSHLGNYNTLSIEAPYSPEKHIEAIKTCENPSIEVIIIDSISHEWTGSGGCLELHDKLGGRFQDWAPITKRHQAFIDKILSSKCHIITTTRRKTDYSMDVGSNGRTKVIKHGTKEITRDGFEYELMINFEIINDNHLAKASKDRTGLFMNKPEFVINAATGKKLMSWCNNGINIETVKQEIAKCETLEGLRHVYSKYPNLKAEMYNDIMERKAQIEQIQSVIIPKEQIVNQQNHNENGDTNTTTE